MGKESKRYGIRERQVKIFQLSELKPSPDFHCETIDFTLLQVHSSPWITNTFSTIFSPNKLFKEFVRLLDI